MNPTRADIRELQRAKILRARKMDPEEKLMAGPRLFLLALETMRAGIRITHPEADEVEVREIIRQRIERQRKRDEVRI